jgi:hypothetical protein
MRLGPRGASGGSMGPLLQGPMPGLATNSLARLGFGLILLSSRLTAAGQCTAADRDQAADRAHAQTIRIGNAEVGTAPVWTVDSVAYRCQHPDVYWHDDNWKIDLLLPATENDPYSLRIRSSAGREETVKLDYPFDQIASVSVTPNDKAIVVAYVYGHRTGVFSVASIFDLKSGALADTLTALSFSISPNRRFLLYLNSGDFDEGGTEPPYQYRLYDVVKTPRENTCGYRINDRQHESLDEEHRGYPLYPRRPHRTSCSDADLKPFDRDDRDWVSNFLWSDDSSKVAFVDEGNQNNLSVVAVTTPIGSKDPPRVSINRLGTSQAGDDEGAKISWSDPSETAVSVRVGGSKAVTIPLSQFVPVP